LSALAATGLCAIGFHFAWQVASKSPQLQIRKASFRGLKRASEQELLKLAGLAAGQNLLALDLKAAERAMAAHPWINGVIAKRTFPDALEFEVTERTAQAVLSMGDLYAVDAQGVPFKKVQAQDELDLPLITGVDREGYLQDRPRWEQRIRTALQVAALYQQRFPGPALRLSELHLSPLGLGLVVGPNGEQVQLGDSDFAEKLDRLQLVRRALASRSLVAEVIRLDDRKRPSRVAVRSTPNSAEGWAALTERSAAPRP
jgi:cell division protein FtsQ